MEVRKDYILDRWVYFSSGRSKRPWDFKNKVYGSDSKSCAFCPGHEKETPKEIGRVEEDGRWIIRWFANKYPALERKGDIRIKTEKKFLKHSAAYGDYEVIVECPEHNKQLWDLETEHIKKVLKVYNERIEKLSKKKNIKYVSIFKNSGKEGGASLMHSHTQLSSFHIIPTYIKEELEAVKKHKKCPYCEIIKLEKKSKRLCFENASFIAFAPYASRFNYEVWFFPKRHVKKMNELREDEFYDFAELLRAALQKLKKINASYDFFIHYSPNKDNHHLHLELIPRIAPWAGFEYSTNNVINSVLPEIAAEFYGSD